MKPAAAERRLRELLVAAGVTAARDATWERPAVPAAGDPVSLTRQFHLADEDGEYHDQRKVDCAFLFTPTAALRAIEERGEWSFDFGGDLDAFLEWALALPGFQVADAPVGLRIYST